MSEALLAPFVEALTAHGMKPNRIAPDCEGGACAYFLFEHCKGDEGYVIVHADGEGVSALDYHPRRGINAEDIVDVEHCVQVVAKYIGARTKAMN